MTLLECCTQYASKFGKLSNGVSQDWKRSGCFHFIPKDGQFQESLKFHTTALISYASKVILKILQARLQLYMNKEHTDVQAEFRKVRGIRDQIGNIIGSSKKQESSRKMSTSALLTMPVALTVWITTNCGKFWNGNTRPPDLPPEKSVCRSRSNS